jgi:hypothetical protein
MRRQLQSLFFFTITTEKKKKKQTNDLTGSSGKKTGCMHVHVIISLQIHNQNSPFSAVLAAVATTSKLVGMPTVAMDESWRVATKKTRAAGALVGSAASFYRTLQSADRNLIFYLTRHHSQKCRTLHFGVCRLLKIYLLK